MKSQVSLLRSTVLIFISVFMFSGENAKAEAGGPFGLGIVIGDPTGLSANYMLSAERSVDAAVAWSFGRYPGFEIHADYLWHRPNLFRIEQVSFDWHYGIGGRLISTDERDASNRPVNDRTYFGPRIPIGISTDFNKSTFELFSELALVMNLIPATNFDFDFGVGVRVYF
ncbi:MAG: hypothetical protein U1E10_16935 [Bdellovibrionales bacterium]|nr:hypothetical protein [Bdellovibrionales bacterium]